MTASISPKGLDLSQIATAGTTLSDAVKTQTHTALRRNLGAVSGALNGWFERYARVAQIRTRLGSNGAGSGDACLADESRVRACYRGKAYL